MQQHYDYIIAGAGCAGLSLLQRMMQNPFFSKASILLVDQQNKNTNDRTWCFWEQEAGLFDSIVAHSWPAIAVHTGAFSKHCQLHPYRYKMIRGIDFYNYVLGNVRAQNNITHIQGTVTAMGNGQQYAWIEVEGISYTAGYIFSSILPGTSLQQQAKEAGAHYLLQHFKGWVVETDKPVFDAASATFMDFRVSQATGTAFVYVLPFSANKALVEYTQFSSSLLADADYNAALQQYFTAFLPGCGYHVVEEEKGVIPMTDFVPQPPGKRVVLIGTAGGDTKASSGYTFRFIQKHTAAIVQRLQQGKQPQVPHSFWYRRFRMYDATLLHILVKQQMQGSAIFGTLFQQNPVQVILRFLDNESSLRDEWQVMRSLPAFVFMRAALQQLLRLPGKKAGKKSLSEPALNS
ncbi:lycopene cyclase family protein [Deminuibacter soli]|uniref:Lycopene cyclase n=1 Tax=Deminuibacter soli TaxID=2291815 RepID=A0A3E1NF79_9BACT|nr:lycopene cyclase family protein [Deminuibacter soli]RFM26633.1 lycopene cyclase [Deminuibacter soli]